MTTSVLDPTNEQTPEHRERAQRISSLQGATIGLLDISKPRGDVFLDTIQSLLEKKGATVLRYCFESLFSRHHSGSVAVLISDLD